MTITVLKQEIFDYINLSMGGGMVDIELDPAHYEVAFKQALTRYRQRSSNALEESYSYLELVPDQNEYTLPVEVIAVRQIFRRGTGQTGAIANQFDPFVVASMNFYNITASGGLATFFMARTYMEEVSKMFGGYINYAYNTSSKKLTLMMRPRVEEEKVLLWTYNQKPDFMLLTDQYAQPWIKEYTYALCKKMVGEAREKFQSIPGPQGGSSLNGTQLKAEAQALIEKLELEIDNYIDGSMPPWFVIG